MSTTFSLLVHFDTLHYTNTKIQNKRLSEHQTLQALLSLSRKLADLWFDIQC